MMTEKMFMVKKTTLLLIAGIVWLIAGINVARLGIISYLEIEQRWYWYLLSVLVFAAFGTMFFRMSQKHTKRIMSYREERQPFWRFFDLKAYIIMAVMMGGGIGLRSAGKSQFKSACKIGATEETKWVYTKMNIYGKERQMLSGFC